MYQIVRGSAAGLPDVHAFIQRLHTLDQNPLAEARGFFAPQRPLFVGRAPGRLDVMGGIADYSGSLVLQLPLREATLVAVQRDPERRLQLVSFGAEANRRAPRFEMSLAMFENRGKPVDYADARAYFQQDPQQHWAAYVAGSFLALMQERGVRFPEGARILIDSNVPEGKGVSSSAALEVAVMQAVTAAFDISLPPRDLALLCQKVENLVAGAPCGVMDQMTAVYGEPNRLMALLCQPAELQGMVSIPEEVTLWGIDSGVRHSVSGADYSSVRVGAFMGYRMIVEQAGLEVRRRTDQRVVEVNDPRWQGYLANLTPSEFEQHYAGNLPETMRGLDFLERYGGTTDPVTEVHLERQYAVRTPTAHPIYEHFRVRAFAELLQEPLTERRMELLGELMYQSHASYSACGLGSEGTDLLVQLVREAGPKRGLYGAKITGGGSGGTVAVLGKRDASSAVKAIAAEYERRRGYEPILFEGSSPGSLKFGTLKLTPEGRAMGQ